MLDRFKHTTLKYRLDINLLVQNAKGNTYCRMHVVDLLTNAIHRGSYMSAHVLLNLDNLLKRVGEKR